MLRERTSHIPISGFLRYLAERNQAETTGLPPLTELSRELGISVAALREQLEVARALGLVEVKPRTGTKRLPFTFLPAVRQSLGYAMTLNDTHFQLFADLRKHVETAYWFEAVNTLNNDDQLELKNLIDKAWYKLRGTPVQIPHEEHRNLHLMIYQRLDNPFVSGILEAYWEAYEAIGLNVFSSYDYLQEVWDYHTKMVESICNGNYEAGFQALMDHTDLIHHRPAS